MCPSYTKLRVFGCLCYPWVRLYNNHKLESRSRACIFIGYLLYKMLITVWIQKPTVYLYPNMLILLSQCFYTMPYTLIFLGLAPTHAYHGCPMTPHMSPFRSLIPTTRYLRMRMRSLDSLHSLNLEHMLQLHHYHNHLRPPFWSDPPCTSLHHHTLNQLHQPPPKQPYQISLTLPHQTSPNLKKHILPIPLHHNTPKLLQHTTPKL